MRVWKWIDEKWHFSLNFRFFWRVPSLNGHSSAHRGALDPVTGSASKVHFRPEIQSIEQNWWKSCDGYPLWLDVACLPEVPLSWVTVPWQEHFILMVLGFWIFAKLHSRPEKWVFEHRWAIFTKFGEIPQMVALFIWPKLGSLRCNQPGSFFYC